MNTNLREAEKSMVLLLLIRVYSWLLLPFTSFSGICGAKFSKILKKLRGVSGRARSPVRRFLARAARTGVRALPNRTAPSFKHPCNP